MTLLRSILFRLIYCHISSALTIGMAESDINSEIAELKAELLIIERKLAQMKPKLDLLHSEISKIEEVNYCVNRIF